LASVRETISGELEYISYLNAENDYTVARFREQEKGEGITVVGHLAGVHEGECLRLTGLWKHHPRFGRQFEVESFEFIHPETIEGVEKYLASGLIKGIGPKTAQKIVACFGLQTLEVIDRDPDRLKEVPRLGRRKIRLIREAWEEQRGIRRAMVFLQGYGLGGALASRVYRIYREKTVELVSLNPYRLAEEVPGIGFTTADRIAGSLGLPEDSPLRLTSGLVYAVENAEDHGHTCLPRGKLLEEAARLLQLSAGQLEEALDSLIGLGRLVVPEPSAPGQEQYVYSSRCFRAEQTVLEGLARVVAWREIGLPDLEAAGRRRCAALNEFEERRSIDLSPEQRAAVLGALRDRVAVITGGPGTGKTTVVGALIDLAERERVSVILAAPTGRAAKRMSETAGRPASTIHRLLGWSFQEGGFLHDQARPLEGEVFVLDEVSMVDLLLFASFIEALPPGAVLILVGDVDQLPSIGPGKVLADLIDSGSIPVYRLFEIFRQAGRSLIIRNAHRIREGRMPVEEISGDPGSAPFLPDVQGLDERDFFLVSQPDPEKLHAMLVRLATERLQARFGIDPRSDLQVITPMNKGACGTRALNQLLQQALNPEGLKVGFSGRDLRVGDRVMQIRNDYEKDVFNGDIGRIHSFDSEIQTVAVDFDGRVVSYEVLELEDLEIAYAVTVHKSQGSEYPAVIIILLREHYIMLQRNLLYTAVSRGRRVVVLLGDPRAVALAVENSRIQIRHTRLAERLRARLGQC
jgi:exodeoxyribonuclease V alpha subunit